MPENAGAGHKRSPTQLAQATPLGGGSRARTPLCSCRGGVRLAQACASLYSLGILGLLCFFVVRQSLRYQDARTAADRAACSVAIYRSVSLIHSSINVERGMSLGHVVGAPNITSLPADRARTDAALDGIGDGPCYESLAATIANFRPALAAVRNQVDHHACLPLVCSKPYGDFQDVLIHSVADVGGPFTTTSSMAYVASLFMSYRHAMGALRGMVYEILWSLTVRPMRVPPEDEIRELTSLLGALHSTLQLSQHAGPLPIRDVVVSTLGNATNLLTDRVVNQITSVGGAVLAAAVAAGSVVVPHPDDTWAVMSKTVITISSLDATTATYFSEEVDDVEHQVKEELALAIIAALVCLLALFTTRTALLLGRRESELQREKEAGIARRIFVRYVFHEVRVPLQSLALGIELLRDSLGGGSSPRGPPAVAPSAMPALAAAAATAAPRPAAPAEGNTELSAALLDEVTTTTSGTSSSESGGPDEPADPSAILLAMSDACSGMSRIMGDVLDWERMEAGKFSVERVWHSFPASVAHVAGLMKPLAAGRGVSVLLTVTNPSHVLRIAGDKYRLRQVVANLLSNACKYAPRGSQVDVGVSIEVVQVAIPSSSSSSSDPLAGSTTDQSYIDGAVANANEEWEVVAASDNASVSMVSTLTRKLRAVGATATAGTGKGRLSRFLRRRRRGSAGSSGSASRRTASAAPAPFPDAATSTVQLPASPSSGAGMVLPTDTLLPPVATDAAAAGQVEVSVAPSREGNDCSGRSSSSGTSKPSTSARLRGYLRTGAAAVIGVGGRRSHRGTDVGSAFLNHVISVAAGGHQGVTARPPGAAAGQAVPSSPMLLAAPFAAAEPSASAPDAAASEASAAVIVGASPASPLRMPHIPRLSLSLVGRGNSDASDGQPVLASATSMSSLSTEGGPPLASSSSSSSSGLLSTASQGLPALSAPGAAAAQAEATLVAVPQRGRARVTVSVRDQGVGISKPDQQRLFRPFEQIRSGDNQKGVGTGLGLVISASIVALHGGAIWVDSEPGAGSTFTFSFETEFFGQMVEKEAHSDVSVPVTQSKAGPAEAEAPATAAVGPVDCVDRLSARVCCSPSPSPPNSGRRSGAGDTSARASAPAPAAAPVPAPASAPSSARGEATGGPPISPRAVAGAAAALEAEAQLQAIKEAGLLALVVDDYASNRIMLAHMLGRMGLTVDTAEDGAVAVSMLQRRAAAVGADTSGVKSRQYDIIFMDKTMPVLDGAGASIMIREGGFKGVILGVTGNALSEDIAGFVAAGADMVLPKPVPKDVLVSAIYQTALAQGASKRR